MRGIGCRPASPLAAGRLARRRSVQAGLPCAPAGPAPPITPPLTQPAAELTGQVRSAEREAAYPREEGAHEAQVASLAAASAEAHENVDALNRQLQALQAQRADIKAQVAALQRKADHIEQIVTDAEPRTRWVPAVWHGQGERLSCCCVYVCVAAAVRGCAEGLPPTPTCCSPATKPATSHAPLV